MDYEVYEEEYEDDDNYEAYDYEEEYEDAPVEE
jgi:hypothetical protein